MDNVTPENTAAPLFPGGFRSRSARPATGKSTPPSRGGARRRSPSPRSARPATPRIRRRPRKTARTLAVALNRTLAQYPARLRLSLTYDNGSENTEHRRVNAVLGTRSCCCAPFHSWEKGTVENTLGLVRRCFPKGTDFTRLPARAIKRVERWLNHRPRKCLNYQTPAEVFRRERCT